LGEAIALVGKAGIDRRCFRWNKMLPCPSVWRTFRNYTPAAAFSGGAQPNKSSRRLLTFESI
jgi:hypothetical protein